MKKLIAIAFFAIVVVTSSAQTTQKYQEVSFERFQELKDSLSTDSLLEFEVLSFDYINTPSANVDTAVSDLKKHNLPDPSLASLYAGRAQYSASNDTINRLDTTYVCITRTYEFGSPSITLNIITSSLNVTWTDDSIK